MSFPSATVVGVAAATAVAAYFLSSLFHQREAQRLAASAKTERETRIRMQIALGAAEAKLSAAKATSALTSTSTSSPIDKDAESDSDAGVVLPLKVIGHVATPYSTRNGTPRQPSLVPSARAKLTLHKSIPKSALQCLDQFSHAWIIFHFNQNTNVYKVHKNQFKGTIKPPRLNGASVGVFSTRTPHRPAPIGLSLARILEVNVEKGYVLFEGLDLVHGTPVVDIKPYVAFSDTPASLLVPSYTTPTSSHYSPAWVTKEIENDEEPLTVESVSFTPTATTQLSTVFSKLKKKEKQADGISLYATVSDFTQFIIDNLSLDFRSTRERTDPKLSEYRVTLCDIVVHYHFVDGVKVVVTGAEEVREEYQQPKNIPV
ncbi:hypothetical protein BCR33DRAFT_718539 [Rhizoclosmatium globosum]|uniref:TsaA-like domain-containing protein n=1 Tax=Rhizoclosmatium globosum TaxID=329046 RepID=A0A1Y2C4C4_9FUNG|nr:hypothetical protein BCR33DRAFT_718539 [Rhizoclosmatium globosum]|eukprot:ORY41869.1 hypothetical protein BCR33DRAFT_718539 [Rhizoclosmatium globosum]